MRFDVKPTRAPRKRRVFGAALREVNSLPMFFSAFAELVYFEQFIEKSDDPPEKLRKFVCRMADMRAALNRNIDGFAADIAFAVTVFIGMTERFHLTVGECVIAHLACVHRAAALRACGGYNGINIVVSRRLGFTVCHDIAANRAGVLCVTALRTRCGSDFIRISVSDRHCLIDPFNIAANRAGTFCVTAFGARCGNVFFDKAVFKRGDVVTCKRAAM